VSTDTTSPPLSARQHAENFSGRRRTIALVVVALAFIMDLLDSTIVNIAIPSIQANLGASYTMIQWLVAGYSLAFALLLITGGRMGDVFGYKKLFMIGVAGFTVASLLSGLAWTPEVLIAARLFQGTMAALMVPQVMSLMQVMYKPKERGSVNGLFGALAGIAASLGPIVGGLLIQANIFGLDWRPIFLINVPIGIFGLWAAAKYLPEGKSAHPLKLDTVGTGLIIVALSLLVFPLIQGRELDWPAWTFAMMAAAVPVFVIFAWWQLRKDKIDGSPLVLPALFRRRSFSLGVVVNILFEAVMLGFFLTFTLLLQAGLGYSVLHAALTGIATGVGISVSVAVLGQKVIMKLGRYALTLGAAVTAIGLVLVSVIANANGLALSGWYLAPALIITGVGMGLVMMPIFAVALNDVDHNHAGSASGTLNAVQQVGGAIGIAAIGVIFFGQITSHATVSVSSVTPQIQQELTAQHVPAAAQKQIISGVEACYHDRVTQKDSTHTPDSCKAASGPQTPASQAVGQVIEHQAKVANADNFNNAFRWGVVYELSLLVLIAALSFFLPRHIRPEAFEEAM
jgi:EmrB/QacA subfamily drug resistance transporter